MTRSRVIAGSLIACWLARFAGAQTTIVTTDPDSARLVTSDITLFWDVLGRATDDNLEELLQREYLDRGSVGLHDFIPNRILSASDLAKMIRARLDQYEAAHASSLRIVDAEPKIRTAFRKFKELYPDAVFPDVYFVIGRLNSAGTTSKNGLLIGAEMFTDPGRFPAIVAHEIIHFQQAPLTEQPSLLVQSFREGSADFMAEMIEGTRGNPDAQEYGRSHEHELWSEFKSRMDKPDYSGWLYGKPPGERPADLGYFVGYRIAEAYYKQAVDKRAAIRDIVRGVDAENQLARSGYNP